MHLKLPGYNSRFTKSEMYMQGYQLILTDNRGEHAFSSGNIVRLEAADNYTIVYFSNRQRPFIVSKVLKVYEELLSPYGFVRIHRSHLINRQFVDRIEQHNVVMLDASVVRITQRKRNTCIRQLRQEYAMKETG